MLLELCYFPNYIEGKKRFQNGFRNGVASSEVSTSLTTFCRTYHRDIPVGEKCSVNLDVLLLNGAGWDPCALRVGNDNAKTWHGEESLQLKS